MNHNLAPYYPQDYLRSEREARIWTDRQNCEDMARRFIGYCKERGLDPEHVLKSQSLSSGF